MSNRQPVLFYSNKCEHSRRLIQLLQQNPGFARTIIVVDILQERKLPEFLKEDDSEYKAIVYKVNDGDNLGFIAKWFLYTIPLLKSQNSLMKEMMLNLQ